MKFHSIIVLCLFALGIQSCMKGNRRSQELFDDGYVHRIDLSIKEELFENILAYPDSTILSSADLVVEYAEGKDSIFNVGFRIKGNASRGNGKKSYKLSFNAFEKGKKYLGLEKLNLNAHWNDPTHIRAHLSTKSYEYLGVAVPRSAFADLYINGKFHGLYSLGEHIDEEFALKHFGSNNGNLYKCLSISDLTYQGKKQENYFSDDENMYNYCLKTNIKKDDYSGLIQFMDVLNNTDPIDFEDEMEYRFNVDSYLKVMAVDVLIGNWDNYIVTCNNYYLYDDPYDEVLEYIPYDFDNTFGMDWLGVDWSSRDIYTFNVITDFGFNPDSIPELTKKERDEIFKFQSFWGPESQRPLYTRLLEVPKYRKKYEVHLQNLISGYLKNDQLDDEIKRLFKMLQPSMERDTLDNYTWEEIERSYHHGLDRSIMFWSYEHFYLPYGLTDFIEKSTANVQRQLDDRK